MDITIKPRLLCGEIRVPSSKSDIHRILICAALSDKPTRIFFTGLSQDIETTIRCLQALGSVVKKERDCWQVFPRKDSVLCRPTLHCGESGSTLRFLLPVAGALKTETLFMAEGRLPERPLLPLILEMERHGCRFTEHAPPFSVTGTLTSGQYILPGNISSQFITGMMLALPLLPGDSTIRLTSPLESRSYVDMTIRTLRQFGISIQVRPDGVFDIPGSQTYRSPGSIEAEGDWSNAAFWLCAGALGRPVTCRGLSSDTLQGDRKVLFFLRQFGAEVNEDADGAKVSPGPLHAIDLDASDIPDLVPILSVVAAAASGTTRICHAGRLRLKESDRLSAVSACLTGIGAQVREFTDSLHIEGGGALGGGLIRDYNDHRITMAMSIASILCSEEVTIKGAETIRKSYPAFFQDFQHLGGNIHVIDDRH